MICCFCRFRAAFRACHCCRPSGGWLQDISCSNCSTTSSTLVQQECGEPGGEQLQNLMILWLQQSASGGRDTSQAALLAESSLWLPGCSSGPQDLCFLRQMARWPCVSLPKPARHPSTPLVLCLLLHTSHASARAENGGEIHAALMSHSFSGHH